MGSITHCDSFRIKSYVKKIQVIVLYLKCKWEQKKLRNSYDHLQGIDKESFNNVVDIIGRESNIPETRLELIKLGANTITDRDNILEFKGGFQGEDRTVK